MGDGDEGLRGPEQPLGPTPAAWGNLGIFTDKSPQAGMCGHTGEGCKRLRDVSLGPRAPHPPPSPAIGPVTPGICRSFLFSPPKRACLLHVGGRPPGGLAIPGAPGRGSALILQACAGGPGCGRALGGLTPVSALSSLCLRLCVQRFLLKVMLDSGPTLRDDLVLITSQRPDF